MFWLVTGLALFVAFINAGIRSRSPERVSPEPIDDKQDNHQKTSSSGSKAHRPNKTLRAISLIVIVAFISALYELMIGWFPWTKGVRLGGYINSQAIHSNHRSDVVIVDLSKLVPPRDCRHDPENVGDPVWPEVARNWKQLTTVIQLLKADGVRAIAIDWEIGLKDKYYSDDGFFDQTAIPGYAANAYKVLLTTLVAVDHAGTPIAFSADAVEENAERAGRPDTWFPKEAKDAVGMAASAEGPQSSMVDYLATAYSCTNHAGLGPLNEVLIARLNNKQRRSRQPHSVDKLQRKAPLWGFTPFDPEAEERDREHYEHGWKQFWIDFGLVDPQPILVESLDGLKQASIREQLKDKVVVLGDIDSDLRETGDTAIVPHLGATPGSFHHASAIATRINAPVYGPKAEWVEAIYLFGISVALGLTAFFFARLICRLFKWGEDNPKAKWTDFLIEVGVLVLTYYGALWLQSNLARHRLLLPGLPILLLGRLIELFDYIRSAVLHHFEHSPDPAASHASEGGTP